MLETKHSPPSPEIRQRGNQTRQCCNHPTTLGVALVAFSDLVDSSVQSVSGRAEGPSKEQGRVNSECHRSSSNRRPPSDRSCAQIL